MTEVVSFFSFFSGEGAMLCWCLLEQWISYRQTQIPTLLSLLPASHPAPPGHRGAQRSALSDSSFLLCPRGRVHKGASQVAVVKNLPAVRETQEMQVRSLEKGMAIHSITLTWRIPWTEEPGGLRSTESQRIRPDGSGRAAAAEYICQSPSPSLSHPLPPRLCLHVCSLRLHFYSCLANRLLSTIFLAHSLEGSCDKPRFHINMY